MRAGRSVSLSLSSSSSSLSSPSMGISLKALTVAQKPPKSILKTFSLQTLLVIFCCTFLVIVDIQSVTCRSVEVVKNVKKTVKRAQLRDIDIDQAQVVVDDVELEAIPAGDNTDFYVLLPAETAENGSGQDKNVIENIKRKDDDFVLNSGTDSVMMESNNDEVAMQFVKPPNDLKDKSEIEAAEDIASGDTDVFLLMPVEKDNHKQPAKEDNMEELLLEKETDKEVVKELSENETNNEPANEISGDEFEKEPAKELSVDKPEKEPAKELSADEPEKDQAKEVIEEESVKEPAKEFSEDEPVDKTLEANPIPAEKVEILNENEEEEEESLAAEEEDELVTKENVKKKQDNDEDSEAENNAGEVGDAVDNEKPDEGLINLIPQEIKENEVNKEEFVKDELVEVKEKEKEAEEVEKEETKVDIEKPIEEPKEKEEQLQNNEAIEKPSDDTTHKENIANEATNNEKAEPEEETKLTDQDNVLKDENPIMETENVALVEPQKNSNKEETLIIENEAPESLDKESTEDAAAVLQVTVEENTKNTENETPQDDIMSFTNSNQPKDELNTPEAQIVEVEEEKIVEQSHIPEKDTPPKDAVTVPDTQDPLQPPTVAELVTPPQPVATIQLVPEQNDESTPTRIENESIIAPTAAPTTPSTNSLQELPELVALTSGSTQKPFNVVDSALNYVNASFMGQSNKQEQQQQQQQQHDELTYNSKFRRYDGAQVWRIFVQSDKDKQMADELQSKYDGQVWKEVKEEVDYLLKPQFLAAAESHIRSSNLSRMVLIDNLQRVIEVENPPPEEIAQFQNRKGHRLTWKAYHRLDDIHDFFDYLAKTYPDICSTQIIGHSVQKRPLKILKISNGNETNPSIWIDGGMHAREWISPATVTYIANEIVEGWEDLPPYMRKINWYIHAVANPDGYEYSHTTDRLWRKNLRAHGRQCPGVDLNRNFGYKWGGKGTSASPCSQIFRGSKALSEPESFSMTRFITSFPRGTFKAYLSYHSYGQYILYPWGYDSQLTSDKFALNRVGRQAASAITKSSGAKYTVGSSATTLYPAAGGSDDWAKGVARIKYAFTIELGDSGRFGFILPAKHIESNCKDGYIFADTVAKEVTGNNQRRRRLG